MTLNELRFIVSVAQERNFRRAAERSYISQPALSLAIKKLEDELGIQIFERGKTDIGITEVGLQVVEQAQRVLEEVDRLRQIATQGRDQLSTPLRVGVIHSLGPYLLPELIPELRKIAPAMPLEVEENITANLETNLRNGKLDVIVVALPFGDSSITTRALYDEPFEVVVDSAHRWVNRRSIKPSELGEEKVLLLDSGHCYSNQVAVACPDSRKHDDIQHGTSLETIRNMVASGLGITVMPASANSPRYRSKLLHVLPFTKPAPSRRIALAWRNSFARKDAAEALALAISRTRLNGIEVL